MARRLLFGVALVAVLSVSLSSGASMPEDILDVPDTRVLGEAASPSNEDLALSLLQRQMERDPLMASRKKLQTQIETLLQIAKARENEAQEARKLAKHVNMLDQLIENAVRQRNAAAGVADGSDRSFPHPKTPTAPRGSGFFPSLFRTSTRSTIPPPTSIPSTSSQDVHIHVYQSPQATPVVTHVQHVMAPAQVVAVPHELPTAVHIIGTPTPVVTVK
uniref:Uncharacterized protein n=1 Tax=Chromera velia CCMP2878 TaxID=1169474 RepID=A0A0G4H9K5_9ALVE|eukprot:Cvel_25407.t1-p1 / transcript=Cvel_25407.t1 / gene=Cvel_25407 / organism=Chromera_velia_CCMP2878 / gene_product=hypothetical protein / transcript_product=hypothetical protein / location=Cvel_scaffold2875:1191-1841(-) / protein_length=217 / sequence_SO=supercontig / SO=protein_coding / is_pseudo=false